MNGKPQLTDDLDELYKQFDGQKIDNEIRIAELEREKKIHQSAQKTSQSHINSRKHSNIKIDNCQSSTRVDKNGFPIISSSDNLHSLFNLQHDSLPSMPNTENSCNMVSDEDTYASVDSKEFKKDADLNMALDRCFSKEKESVWPDINREKSKKKRNLDKNGLPFLENKKKSSSVFQTNVKSSPVKLDSLNSIEQDKVEPDEDFASLLKESFAGKSQASLLREKKDNMYPVKPISLKKLLQRYPAPQRQLDLHGYIARKADEVADVFIRSASRDGIYTLRIIVGKGLHSENGAVLPDIIENRIIFLKKLNIILTFKWENGKKKKSGAVIVYLVDRER
ncbi:MAG: hypothetical protein B6I31_03605 [Desulfobacteraceae bacterium 4572_19]|nr:MAG: hypothetical protein B6I31_03605 [Desulfobacteraceae bacterium 4572_19]